MFPSSQPITGLALFVHGYLDDAMAWSDSIQAIHALGADGWELVTLDLQELTGDTSTSDLLLEGFAVQVADHALALSTGRKLILIGHSMGGAIVELAAERLGARVKALVLLTPAPLKGSPLPAEVMQRFESSLGGTDVNAAKAGRLAMSQALTEHGLAVLANSSVNTPKSKGLQQLKAWTGGHAAGLAPSSFEGPVLVVATDDHFFTSAALREAARRFRKPSVAHIEGAGHWAHLEKPRELAALVTGFLQQVAATE